MVMDEEEEWRAVDVSELNDTRLNGYVIHGTFEIPVAAEDLSVLSVVDLATGSDFDFEEFKVAVIRVSDREASYVSTVRFKRAYTSQVRDIAELEARIAMIVGGEQSPDAWADKLSQMRQRHADNAIPSASEDGNSSLAFAMVGADKPRQDIADLSYDELKHIVDILRVLRNRAGSSDVVFAIRSAFEIGRTLRERELSAALKPKVDAATGSRDGAHLGGKNSGRQSREFAVALYAYIANTYQPLLAEHQRVFGPMNAGDVADFIRDNWLPFVTGKQATRVPPERLTLEKSILPKLRSAYGFNWEAKGPGRRKQL